MIRTVVLLECAIALALSAPVAAQEPDAAAALALVNATVIDGTGAAPRPAMTIVMRDGVIEDVHPTGSRPLPADARVQDLDGRFVIPGLIDAHVHVGLGSLDAQLRALRLQLRGGVTTIRDPSGDPRITGYLSRQALVGAIDSPDIFYAALMGGPGFGEYEPVAGVSRGWKPGTAPWAREVTAHSDIARVIAEARGTGATGIKMYRYLPPDLAAALAAEAHRQGMRVWSHTRIRGHTGTGEPSSLPGEVVAAGADVLSHANHFACEIMPCTTGEERSRAVATVDPAHPQILAILRTMAERGAILDPTLLNTVTSRSYEGQPQWLRFAAAVTRLAHDAGVAIAAGTDIPMPTEAESLPRLHDELELLVAEAELTPHEAIVAATRTAARAIGQEHERGTIEPGKRADLVVLRGDPTVDIRNTRTIDLVIKAGHTYPDPLDLAAAHVEAIGGRAVLDALRGYHARGTAEIAAQGVRGSVEEWIRPHEAWHERWEIDGFGRIGLGFDGRVAWTIRPDQPPDAIRDEEIREAFASRAVLHPETDLTGHLGSARTIGRREIAGRSTWEVRVTTPAGAVESRFYDEEAGLLRAVERNELLTGELARILTVYDDWRPIDGVLFPYRLTRTGPDLPELVTVLESVTTGPVQPDAVEAPAEDAVEVERDVMVPMGDGARLATDIYRPRRAGERLPVILIRLPYDKTQYSAATGPARFFAERGYVVVVQDSRGKWRSEGEFVVSQSARNDGYDTVEWAASQPWSNGRVGTYGCSYLGENQVMLAAERHPAHIAMIPQAAGGAVGTAGGRYGFFGFFEGGAFSLSAAAGWFPDAGTKDRTDGQAPIPLPVGLHHLPTIDMMRYHGVGPTDWEDVLTKPLDDPWWQTLGYIADSDSFATPALHVNSWYDLGAAETLQLFNLMRRNAVDDSTSQHQYVIISPTTHCRSERAGDNTRVGELDVGDARFSYWETYLRWFDHWLKGADNGVTSMPRVQYYVTGANEWRSADEWPVPEARHTRFYLRGGGAAGERMDDGVLSAQPPIANEPPDRYTYDPGDPLPSRGGSVCCTGNPQDQPGAFDQSDIEQRADVLVYSTPPLDSPLDVVGPLRLSSSAPDTDFTVKLVDVHPDGRAFNVQEGITRARYREGFDRTVWMRPGEVYEVEVDLHATAHRFLAGHRVRVEVSSSNFPRFDRNLNTGGDNVTETEWRIAENAIHHSAARPSHLVLPVVAGGGEAPAPASWRMLQVTAGWRRTGGSSRKCGRRWTGGEGDERHVRDHRPRGPMRRQ